MMLAYPSLEFEDAVAAVCHGQASDTQMRALNELLRNDAAARDDYILRLELHARLASEPELFVPSSSAPSTPVTREGATPSVGARTRTPRGFRANPKTNWWLALAASVVLAALAGWGWGLLRPEARAAATSKAVALLNQTADAQWETHDERPRLGAPLEPGRLKLKTGVAQIVFYSGARVVLEGPAELELISASHASCGRGRMTAEVPLQARGFRIDTPLGTVTDLGTTFGLHVTEQSLELHVFKGRVELQPTAATTGATVPVVQEGAGVVLDGTRAPRSIAADRAGFASLFELRTKSLAAEALRFHRWYVASERLNHDPSLLVRFDFENSTPTTWQLANVARSSAAGAEATIVGCQWVKGRWPNKRALEFQSVSDRVRMNVPGKFEAVTFSAWVRVQGLDRNLNSLFMSDGFDAGTVHWLVRNDGVLGLTVVGEGAGNFQIVKSPPVLTLDRFGMWLHLAVVLDGRAGTVSHYVNGRPVSESALKIKPPYRFGTAELGNWNAKGFPGNDPFLIRNFSGAMDEFCLFSRALDAGEIDVLYAEGKPESEAFALRE